MEPPPLVEPRKSPKQLRSRQTVDKILQAATDVIIANGMDALTTNKIAEAANVNIASLYQYFPNKDAIITAIFEDNINNMADVWRIQLEEMMDLPIKEATKRWLHAGIDFYRQSEGLFPEFVRSYHSTTPFPGTEFIEQRLIETVRRFAMRRRDKVMVENINIAIYVGFNSAMLVMAKHLSDPNSYLKDEEVVDGIAEMLSKYIEG